MTNTAESKKIEDFHLIILQTVDASRHEFLIEEMQEKPSFTPFIVPEDILRKFF